MFSIKSLNRALSSRGSARNASVVIVDGITEVRVCSVCVNKIDRSVVVDYLIMRLFMVVKY